MARSVEQVIVDNGAVPATIAILDGVPRIGLADADLKALAKTGRQARKVSKRDMAACIADAATGGTTVSGTMILAKMAGIKVFVTGGIGGVHQGAERSMDISNDLNELSKNDVAVVCAGPKAILDIPLTLEYLETMGVTVTTVGQQNLPAFYSRDSGIKSPKVSPTPEHAAKLIAANQQLQLGSAVLVCVPIPADKSIDSKQISGVINFAVKQAKSKKIKGKDMTPFLLRIVSEATEGQSLNANIDLVLENARVGSAIAVKLHEYQNTSSHSVNEKPTLEEPGGTTSSAGNTTGHFGQAGGQSGQEVGQGSSGEASADNPESTKTTSSSEDDTPTADILVIGGVAVDTTCQIDAPIEDLKSMLYTSVPGKVERTIGGVGGNIARMIAMTGTRVKLATLIGFQGLPPPFMNHHDPKADSNGQYLIEELPKVGMQLQVKGVVGARTATCTAVQARGELLLAVADMDILSNGASALRKMSLAGPYRAIVFDANIPDVLNMLTTQYTISTAKIICYEPTSVSKAPAIFGTPSGPDTPAKPRLAMYPDNVVNMTTPNIHELGALFNAARSLGYFEEERWWSIINSLNIDAQFRSDIEKKLRKVPEITLPLAELGVVQQAMHLLPLFQNIYVTLGSSGVLSFHLTDKANKYDLMEATAAFVKEGSDYAVHVLYHAPIPLAGDGQIVNATGAGDTFTGMLVACFVDNDGEGIVDSVKSAQTAAMQTLQSKESVSPEIGNMMILSMLGIGPDIE